MAYKWETDADHPGEYHAVEAKRGREFILRMTTGTDICVALREFAKDNDVQIAKIHAAVMGGFQPVRFLVWAPDTANPDNWHNESPMTIQNLSMLLAINGIITPKPVAGGGVEPMPLIHFVAGGAWDVPTIGGHLLEGSLVKGSAEFFVTEMIGIDVLKQEGAKKNSTLNWYQAST